MLENINEVKKLNDYNNMIIKKANIQVRGHSARAAVETSPERRDHLRMWHQSCEMLAMLKPGKEFGTCERALEIWNHRNTKHIG